MRRLARRVLVTVTLVLLTGGSWGVAASGEFGDRRNTAPEYWDAVNGAECYGCHSGQGFHPMQIGLVERFREVPVGEDIELGMRVAHISPMGHRIQEIAVVVNLSAAPNVVVLGDDFVEDLEVKKPVTLRVGEELQESFDVGPQAREVRVVLRATGDETLPPNGLMQGELGLVVTTPERRPLEGKGSPYEQVVAREGDAARDLGTGTFQVTGKWDSKVDEVMDAELEIVVRYARASSEYTIRAPADTVLDPAESAVIPIPIRFTEPGEALLEFRVESVSFYGHPPKSAYRDDGLYYRFETLRVQGGEETISLGAAFAPQPGAGAVDLYNLFARIVGFVALLLVPLALVTGGVFGKGSRRWVNRMTGGAKRRVLWHMSMSWLIIVIASLHFVLALLEGKFQWSKGLLWGGLGWFFLVSLGFTGYYQSWVIKRWDYRVWRQVHLWPAIGVLAFGLFHMVFDGSDLVALRDMAPGVDRLAWP